MTDEFDKPTGHLRLVHSGGECVFSLEDVEPLDYPIEPGYALSNLDLPDPVCSNPYPWVRAIREAKGGFIRIQLDHEQYRDVHLTARQAMNLSAELALIAASKLYHEEG